MKLHIPKGTTAIVRLSEQGVIRINGKQKKSTKNNQIDVNKTKNTSQI